MLGADVYNLISCLLLVAGLYAGLYLAIGQPFLPPNGPAWAIGFIWISALTLGMITDRVSDSSGQCSPSQASRLNDSEQTCES